MKQRGSQFAPLLSEPGSAYPKLIECGVNDRYVESRRG